MSNSYGLFKILDPNIDLLPKITCDTAMPLEYTMLEAQAIISRMLPLMDWDGKYGQVIHPDWGRFECSIGTEYGPHEVPMVLFRTSIHVDYQSKVIEVAEQLDLSVFDSQTGERIYMQKKYKQNPE